MSIPDIIQYARGDRGEAPKTKRYLEVSRRFMEQYTEISNLEKDYEIILVNPAVLNRQQQAHGLLELAHNYEHEGATKKSLLYYTEALEKHNDLVLEAYKTVSLQYMLEVRSKLDMTARTHRLRERATRLLDEARRAYRKAKALRTMEAPESKTHYLLSIKSAAEAFRLFN